jgi:signal transduction histidine kinase/CheY-like chemotaxis protein
MLEMLVKPGLSGPTPLAETLLGTGVVRSGGFPKKIALGRSHQLLELACKITNASQAGIVLLAANSELMEHITVGIAEEAAAGLGRSAPFSKLIQSVMNQAQATCVEEPGAAFMDQSTSETLPFRGPFLGMPLHFPGRYRGILYLARAEGQERFQTRDIEIVKPLRDWLEQGSLYEEAHLLSQLRLLKGVAETAAGNLDLKLILARALRELDRYLPLHVCLVWLVDDNIPDQVTLAASNSIPKTRASALGLAEGMQLPMQETPFQECFSKGQGLYRDLAAEDGARAPLSPLGQQLARHGATCFFAAPLRAGDRTVGILQSVCTRSTGLSGEQIQLLYLVADLLGPAISNCRLYERLRTTYEALGAAQEQLIRVEKMRALGELASGMAHDFNNSLCGVLGFLDLTLLDKALCPTLRNYLESAHTCALDAAQTVRRVQDFARWRRHDPVFQPLNINDLLQQVVDLTRHKWEGLGRTGNTAIRVQVELAATAQVSGCAAELREVLTNLVFNAVDAMPEGGTLTVRSWSMKTDVFFAVADTGVGMSSAVRQRLFEPFFTTKGERGNGMGLSVAFGIIQSHGGEISVASELHQGTTFTIRLPVSGPGKSTAEGQPFADGPANQRNTEPIAAVLAPQSLRILAVDDEVSIRNFLETVFLQLGHQPRVVADADAALTLFSQEHFDLVFTDLSLPGMSGTELARHIAVQAPQVPVVLLTGWASEIKSGSNADGVARILTKPISISNLAETLDAVCPRK